MKNARRFALAPSMDPHASSLSFHVTGSKGPHGPALLTSFSEALHLDDQTIADLDILRPGTKEQIIKIRQSNADPTPIQEFRLGKVTAIPDKEGKTRLITILNY